MPPKLERHEHTLPPPISSEHAPPFKHGLVSHAAESEDAPTVICVEDVGPTSTTARGDAVATVGLWVKVAAGDTEAVAGTYVTGATGVGSGSTGVGVRDATGVGVGADGVDVGDAVIS